MQHINLTSVSFALRDDLKQTLRSWRFLGRMLWWSLCVCCVINFIIGAEYALAFALLVFAAAVIRHLFF